MDDESKLTLHGLVQHYTMLSEDGKNKRLMDLLDQLDFNQVGTRHHHHHHHHQIQSHFMSSACTDP